MMKIGIILQSSDCSYYLYNAIKAISSCKHIELVFMVNKIINDKTNDINSNNLLKKSLAQRIKTSTFNLVTWLECKILSTYSNEFKNHYKSISIKEFVNNNIIELTANSKDNGKTIYYSDSETNKIKLLNLDYLFSDQLPIDLNDKLRKSTYKGILSIRYGSDSMQRNVPYAFWEVVLHKPTTDFILEVISSEGNGRSVLFQGAIPTRRTYIENIIGLYSESYSYLAALLIKYATHDLYPKMEDRVYFCESTLDSPTVYETSFYVVKSLSYLLNRIFNRLVLRKRSEFGVAFVKGPWNTVSLKNGLRVINPPNRFFADPFVVTKNKKTICYVEDYCFKSKRGCITAIEIINEKNYKILGPIIEEPFHMSFPYIFEHGDDLYMIPETCESDSVRLYKCVEFPLKWKYVKNILDDVHAVDTMVFKHGSKWWLLTNMATLGKQDVRTALMGYYSDDPLSDNWEAHKANPLVFDSTIGRNGGILDVNKNLPIRGRQRHGFNAYGVGLSLAVITELTTMAFSEKEIGVIRPNFFPGIKGCHHIHSDENYTVYDYALTQ